MLRLGNVVSNRQKSCRLNMLSRQQSLPDSLELIDTSSSAVCMVFCGLLRMDLSPTLVSVTCANLMYFKDFPSVDDNNAAQDKK